jgi:peptide chain release factor 2
MLLRMYTRWAERSGFKVELMEISDGEEAGIKSATLLLKGRSAYGWAKTEAGVHRLVRISPYDSNARRHTSFASVTVYPVVDDSIQVDLKESDVRIDLMRAQGAGGQKWRAVDALGERLHLGGQAIELSLDRFSGEGAGGHKVQFLDQRGVPFDDDARAGLRG